MGLELLSESPAYRRGVEACAEALKPFGIDLIAAFSDEAGFSEDPILAAVGLIALQVLPLKSLPFVLHLSHIVLISNHEKGCSHGDQLEPQNLEPLSVSHDDCKVSRPLF